MCVLQDGISKVGSHLILRDDPSPTAMIHAFVREDGLRESKCKRKTYSWLVDDIITWGKFRQRKMCKQLYRFLIFLHKSI